MVIGFITLGFKAIKCLRIRHMGLVCVRVRFSFACSSSSSESLSRSMIIGVSSSSIGPWWIG